MNFSIFTVKKNHCILHGCVFVMLEQTSLSNTTGNLDMTVNIPIGINPNPFNMLYCS